MRATWAVLAIMGLSATGLPASADAQEYVVVVNAENPITTLTK